MDKDFPLYPELSDQGKLEAQQLIDGFKEKIKKAASEVISDLYCDITPHIESDSWTNFRNQLMDGFRDYSNRKVQGEYEFKEIRKVLLKEFRNDIIKDLNQDLVEENETLKKDVERLRESLREARRF